MISPPSPPQPRHPDGGELVGPPYYTYVVVREDLPIVDQVIQVAHACLEAAWLFPRPHHLIHLVLLSVGSQKRLLELAAQLSINEVNHYLFYEPDPSLTHDKESKFPVVNANPLGYTALCTEPIKNSDRDKRRLFRGFTFWSH